MISPHLYLIYRYGHKPLPDLRFATTEDEVRDVLARMFFGSDVGHSRKTVDGMVDHFFCPTNWWCGVMRPIEGEIDGGIGAIQLRRR